MVSWLDLILLIPIVIGLVKGFIHGFMNEIASIIAVTLGYTFSHLFASSLAGWMVETLNWNADLSLVLSFILIFGIITVGLFFVARLLTKATKQISLEWVNRLLGAALGAVKWSLIILVIVLAVHRLDNYFHFFSKELKDNSPIYMISAPISEKMWEETKGHINEDGSININK